MSKIAVYSSESVLRSPKKFFSSAFSDLWQARHISSQILKRSLRQTYRQTLFGYLWGMLPAVALGLAMSIASSSKVVSVGDVGIPYPAYVVISMVLWQTFIEAANGPLGGLAVFRPMLTRVLFPKEAIFLCKIGEVIFNFGLKMAVIIGVFVWFDIPVQSSVLLFPFAVLSIIVLGSAVGILLVPVGIIMEDVKKAMPIVFFLGMFVTPILYAPPKTGVLSTIVGLNPVTPLLVTARDFLIGQEPEMMTEFLLTSASAAVLFLVSWVFFRLAMPYVIDRLGT